jgi:hypothetical protein
MTGRSIAISAAAILMLAAPASLPAWAQANPSSGGPAVPSATATQTAEGEQAVARAEKWINDLHARLHITSAEQRQWEAMAQVMRANALHIDQVYAAQQGNPATATALDDMRAYAAITEAHAEDIQKMLPAFEALYNAMSPDQRRTADSVFRDYARQSQMRRAAHS